MEADFASEYPGVDLLGIFTGELTMRRLMVLMSGLRAGSRLQFARGGPGAWSDVVAAVHHEGHLIRSNITSVMGAKKTPQRVEPPEVGWLAKQRDQAERARQKRERYRMGKRKLNRS